MKSLQFYIIAILIAVSHSCTLNKTDYEAEISTDVTEYYEFKEVSLSNVGAYKVSIESLNGTFYKGYNEIHVKILDTQTNQFIKKAAVKFLPIKTALNSEKSSCPHEYQLKYKPNEEYYLGYSVFLEESDASIKWKIYIDFTVNNESYTVAPDVVIKAQPNKNLNITTFKGKDGKEYVIALLGPQKPKIAENKLVAGIYQYDPPLNSPGVFPDPSQFLYSQVKGYSLLLDPRMPEPSMGNHSSINNKNLVQQEDGLYYGIVNYTMTGNWTLNFIMLDQNGKIIKGTQVSNEFTPGIEGAKSDLFINILF